MKLIALGSTARLPVVPAFQVASRSTHSELEERRHRSLLPLIRQTVINPEKIAIINVAKTIVINSFHGSDKVENAGSVGRYLTTTAFPTLSEHPSPSPSYFIESTIY